MSSVVCPSCKRQIAPASPRVIYADQAYCMDCSYYREMGKYNPRKK